MLRADPSYPTVALFHVSLTLRKILKRRLLAWRLLWRDDGRGLAVSVWLLREEGGATSERWCRQWVRTASCRFGGGCRHAHVLTLASHGLSPGRGAAMPPLELSPDPASLSADELRRVAFIVGRGAVAFDYEDPHAAKSFLEADAATQLAAEEAAASRCGEDAAPAAAANSRPYDEFPQLPDELWTAILERVDDVEALRAAASTNAHLSAAAANLWAARGRCFASEAALGRWRRATAAPPLTLDPPG
ncbi:hypothetical protein EMIHUDRAFT_207645 [Emiliania huxleyi CCMP1516]|uniref:C3H1-type domain-containing protein n=2 Tax=Emiliania huxleyi TaxID=2903 RepID=A0A0D3JDS4_EMIH1|nr:hypothetical protein EMIHUDRAFT_207645 [Emiliania huxleyi CCMP1516]EOD21659.1 hypothetical protein EMIHUDRAFT_207645 [Emiliania huxleyi CCMP1516]|eukprot:XP_005774088.1 hypothetical protein EMIHUDRAFT_207645 [Emiliania huxleyi CCMP1516]